MSRKNLETKEREFFGVVKVKKAALINPSSAQLMSYYMDYGYNTIEEVLDEYSTSEMLREWYINQYLSEGYRMEDINRNIHPIDWDMEYEEVDVIDREDWMNIYENTYSV